MNQKQTPQTARRSRLRYPKIPYSPTVNRWTGKPHKHLREIERNLRQRQAR